MSAEKLFLGLDAGSGGGRAVVFNEKGEIKARAYRAWGYYSRNPMDVICQEFDPVHYWKLLCECTKEVLSQVDKKQLCAVSSTSMRQGCLFLDEKGEYIYAGPNRDVRGINYAVEMEELLGKERCFGITGRWPPWIFVPSRLRWFKEEEPEKYARIKKILMLNDWILYLLSGEAVGEPSNACETMLYDVKKKDWSQELLDLIGLDRTVLPRLAKAGEVIGKIGAKAEAETSIPQGVLVVVGGADSQSALVACRQTKPGELGLIAGTTLPVMMSLSEPMLDTAYKLWTHCHMFDDLYLMESQGGDAGKILRGYVEGHFGRGIKEIDQKYQELIKLAEEVGPGSAGVRAFLGTLVWDLTKVNPNKPAAILFPFPPEEKNAGPGNVGRAILETIAFSAKANLEQIIEVTGKEPAQIFLCGGLTRISLFNQIMASVLNQTIWVNLCAEASSLGIAMAGAVGAGLYPDLKTASKEMSGEFLEVSPVLDWIEEYESSFEIWKENYYKLEEW